MMACKVVHLAAGDLEFVGHLDQVFLYRGHDANHCMLAVDTVLADGNGQ